MQRALSQTGVLLGLLAALLGCDPEPTMEESVPPLTEEGRTLLNQVEGRWKISGTSTNTCPDDAEVAFPMGETQWTVEGESLVIDGTLGGVTLTLYPLDETTFSREVTSSWGDCSITQTLVLEISEQGAGTLRGVFSGVTDVSSGIACPTSLDASLFPCDFETDWAGFRL